MATLLSSLPHLPSPRQCCVIGREYTRSLTCSAFRGRQVKLTLISLVHLPPLQHPFLSVSSFLLVFRSLFFLIFLVIVSLFFSFSFLCFLYQSFDFSSSLFQFLSLFLLFCSFPDSGFLVKVSRSFFSSCFFFFSFIFHYFFTNLFIFLFFSLLISFLL